MPAAPRIRSAVIADAPIIAELIRFFGYAARTETLAVLLESMLTDARHAVVVAEDEQGRVLGLLSLSSRPVLRLQGWAGTIEELVIRPGVRGRGVGDRLIQYAKGLTAERGWARLEAPVARLREAHRRGFLFSRGFMTAETVTYRWATLESRHPKPPMLGDDLAVHRPRLIAMSRG